MFQVAQDLTAELPLNPQPELGFHVHTTMLIEPPRTRDREAQRSLEYFGEYQCVQSRAEQVFSHFRVCIGSRNEGRILISPWIRLVRRFVRKRTCDSACVRGGGTRTLGKMRGNWWWGKFTRVERASDACAELVDA